jgi:type IV secretory pathway VirB10-like protein
MSCVAVVVVACGGSQTPPAEPAPPSEPVVAPTASSAPPAPAEPEAAPSASAEPPAPAPRDWDALTEDQKKEIMKTEVLPKMKGLFQEFDAKRFADVKCTTCHGPGAMQGKFDMPNPKLPKLDPKNGFEKHKKKDAKILAFMMEHVVPEMAKIINEPVYDPATQKGFGCSECHTMVGMK